MKFLKRNEAVALGLYLSSYFPLAPVLFIVITFQYKSMHKNRAEPL